MLVDQDEINQLLAQADTLRATNAPDQQAAPARKKSVAQNAPPELQRLLRLRVPVIVQLSTCTMHIRRVRELSLGSIVEFEKSVDDPLHLLINNRRIGAGVTVKVGENFGLKITHIESAATRIKSMGH